MNSYDNYGKHLTKCINLHKLLFVIIRNSKNPGFRYINHIVLSGTGKQYICLLAVCIIHVIPHANPLPSTHIHIAGIKVLQYNIPIAF